MNERQHVSAVLAEILGERLLQLTSAMLDCDVPPIFLMDGSLPARVSSERDECLRLVREAIASSQAYSVALDEVELPWDLADRDDRVSAVLEAATREISVVLPESLLESRMTPSRLFEAVPGLHEHLGDDGLVACTELDAGPQVMIVGDYAVQYHQFLRRHFTSRINCDLIGDLLEISRRPDNQLRLAIDERRVMRREEFAEFFEKDFWYGPHLSEGWLDDPYSEGRTVHRDPLGEDTRTGYTAFFAYWRNGNPGEKIVQMEELVPVSVGQLAGHVLVRYLHAIRDMDRGVFTHCDGAVRAYAADEYLERLREEMPPTTRAQHYRKVFRIDGRIETDEWSNVVARWFRHNSLVTEYLSDIAAD